MTNKIRHLFILMAIASAIFVQPAIARADLSKQAAIDSHTDDFFYSLYPELNLRAIQSDETRYIQEWTAIQNVVTEDMVYASPPCSRGGVSIWRITYSRELQDRVADAIFHVRHPEWNGRSISPSETDFIREWNEIRRAILIPQLC